MNAPELVRRYATTLLETALEKGRMEPVRRDAERLLVTLGAAPDLSEFLANRLATPPVVAETLRQLFAGRIEPLVLDFLLLMAGRRRSHLLASALQAFAAMAEERAGIVVARVRSAVPLSAAQTQRLAERLGACVGRRVRLLTSVDPGLRGGFVARLGDTVFDGSVASHLARLRRRLLQM